MPAFIGLVVLLLGPTPRCVSLAAVQPPGRGHAVAAVLAFLVAWCALQTGLAVGMGALDVLELRTLIGAEAALLVVGLLFLFPGCVPSLVRPKMGSLTLAEQTVVLGILCPGRGR